MNVLSFAWLVYMNNVFAFGLLQKRSTQKNKIKMKTTKNGTHKQIHRRKKNNIENK